MAKAVILLEDGKHFTGTSFGAPGERAGEMVFNTSMTGYQEIITDPSYKGQIITMTYPLIGNYGVNDEDLESDGPKVEGLIVKEYCRNPYNWRSSRTLQDYLLEHGVIAIEGVDTRALTLHLRSRGAMKGIISTEDTDIDSLKGRLDRSPGIEGLDLVKEVTCMEPYEWRDGRLALMENGFLPGISGAGSRPLRVVAYDCGIKYSILRIMASLGCEVTVIPASTKASKVLEMGIDGVFVSNGPGDPEGIPYLIKELQMLIPIKPMFGICLGQQIIGLALGGKTFKLKFGHRGANHPVKDQRNGRILITAQNHGFCVDPESVSGSVEPTFINLNDGTLAGMRHRIYPVYSVQFHPEFSPGPHDTAYLFGDFVKAMWAKRGDAHA